jgi:hypothetical protein
VSFGDLSNRGLFLDSSLVSVSFHFDHHQGHCLSGHIGDVLVLIKLDDNFAFHQLYGQLAILDELQSLVFSFLELTHAVRIEVEVLIDGLYSALFVHHSDYLFLVFLGEDVFVEANLLSGDLFFDHIFSHGLFKLINGNSIVLILIEDRDKHS